MSNEKNHMPGKLPIPWYWDITDFSQQLYNEITSGHLMEGKKVKSIARRQDMDDFLFEIENDEYQFAVVHLTWTKTQVSNKWPITRLYKDWNDVYQNRILKDKWKPEDL